MTWVGNSTQKIHFCVMYRPDEVSGSAASLLRWGGLSASAVPPVRQLDDPVAGGGAGELAGLLGRVPGQAVEHLGGAFQRSAGACGPSMPFR